MRHLIASVATQYRRVLLQATCAWWCLSILGNILAAPLGMTPRVSFFFVMIACPIGLLLLFLSVCASIIHWHLLRAGRGY